MKMNAKRLGMAVCMAALPLFGGQLAADTIATTGYSFGGTVTNSGFNDFKMGGIDVTVLDPNNGNAQVLQQNGLQAGLFEWTTNDSRFADGYFYSFCVEILQTAAAPVTFDVISLADAPNPGTPVPGISGMGNDKATRIKQLWAAHFEDLFDSTAGINIGATAANNAQERRVEAAAFQVAIWNIVYDTDDSVSTNSGTFFLRNISSDVNSDEYRMVQLANTWLAELGETATGQSGLMALSTPSGDATAQKQDQVIQLPPGFSTTPIPSPVAAGMGLIGFVMLGFRRQREIA